MEYKLAQGALWGAMMLIMLLGRPNEALKVSRANMNPMVAITTQRTPLAEVIRITPSLVVASKNTQVTNLALSPVVEASATQNNIEFKLVGDLLNYPNPFSFSSGQTQIGFRLTTSAYLTFKVYSLRGELIHSQELSPSDYGRAAYNKIPFSKTTLGSWLTPGVYLYFLIHDGRVLAKNRMVVLP